MCPPGPSSPSPQPPALDGGWGWVIVASGFLALLLGYGSPQSVGVLYPEWLLVFGEGKATTAWVGSLVTGVGLVVGPVCSACVVCFGAQPVTIFSGVVGAGGFILSAFAPNIAFLIFSYGIVVGVGLGLLYAAILTITCLYFDRRRGLALGIVTTGTSVGGFLYSTLQSELIKLLGLDGCLLIVGVLALNVVACAGLMRPLTPSRFYLKQRAAVLKGQLQEEVPTNQKPAGTDAVITMETKDQRVKRRSLQADRERETAAPVLEPRADGCFCLFRGLSSMGSLLQDRVFMALCMSLFFFSLGNTPPQIFLEDLAHSSGLTGDVHSLSLISLVSIGAGVGKLGLGVTADVPRVDSVLLYALTVGVSGLGVLLIPFASSYLHLQVLSVILGFLSGNWTLTPYITGQVVATEKFAEAHGILMFFGGVGIMLGPPVVGRFYDVSQSYDVAFFISGSFMMLCCIILFLASVLSRRETLPTAPETEPVSCAVTMVTTSPVT
uniref:Major facilitator superfamily (MFS) profile domain-containing protein n=1 Tax=Anabas testudineus TaxID=64144 RepID=A0A3Q1IL60_ANATE